MFENKVYAGTRVKIFTSLFRRTGMRHTKKISQTGQIYAFTYNSKQVQYLQQDEVKNLIYVRLLAMMKTMLKSDKLLK